VNFVHSDCFLELINEAGEEKESTEVGDDDEEIEDDDDDAEVFGLIIIGGKSFDLEDITKRVVDEEDEGVAFHNDASDNADREEHGEVIRIGVGTDVGAGADVGIDETLFLFASKQSAVIHEEELEDSIFVLSDCEVAIEEVERSLL